MTCCTLGILVALALPGAAEARTLTVQDAVRLALEHDRSVAAAEAGEDKARIEARAALFGLGPALSLTGSYTYLGTIPYVEFDMGAYTGGSSSTCQNIDPSTLPAGWTVEMATQFCELLMSWMGGGSTGPTRIPMGLHDNYAVTAEVQQVLFAGGALLQARRAAVDLHDASEEQVRAARQQAAYAAEQAFWGVLLAGGAAQVTAEAAATVEAYVRDLENLVDVGIASRADLLAAQARHSQARLDAMRAAHGLTLAQAMFKVSLGIPDAEPIELVADTTPVTDLPAERGSLLDRALVHRPDLKALDENLQAMDHYRKAAWGQWLPSVAVVGQVGWRNPDYSLEPVWYETSSVTVAASWSFWDRGAALHRARAAAAAQRQVQLQRELAVEGMGIEIRSAVSGWDEAAAEVEVARAGLAQAEESHRLEQERFKAGVVANTELLAAQAALSGARLSLLQAQTRLRMSRAALVKAIGIDPEVS
ncbi:MAG: TolC family protein [Deltaproteobacteria bacterium]|nr:TolC family protein [Deltaproteobacteria bacterium]